MPKKKEMVEETIETKVKTTVENKKDKTVSTSDFEKLEKMFLASQEDNKQLKEALNSLVAKEQVVPQNTQSAQNYSSSYFTSSVKIVHLVEREAPLTTSIKLSNLEIKLSKFGEERNLSVQQFEELVGKYRNWFDLGLLALSSDNEEMAEHYGLNTTKSYPIDSGFVRTLGTQSMETIEKVYSKLPEATKDFIIGYWKRKIYSKDPQFKVPAKIETLNRITDGAMADIIAEQNAERQRSK